MSKRNIEIKVRLSRKEAEALQKRVKKSGLSREGYIRHLISGSVPRDAPPADYFSMMRELHGIGNNLNQISKRLNVHGQMYETEIEEVQQKQNELWVMMRQLLSLLDRSE